MNKSELIAELSKVSKLTKRDCRVCLEALTGVVSDKLSSGENIILSGFGKFEVKNVCARNSYNPYLKKMVKLPSKLVPSFKPGKNLKESVL